MTVRKTLLTAEDLEALPDDGGRRELHRGELVEMSPTNFVHAFVVIEVGAILRTFVRERRLGVVIGGDPGIVIERGPDTVLGPDVAFVARDRMPRPIPRRGFTDLVPDLVVEVASPDDRPGEFAAKTGKWLTAGARLVWNVYPVRETVEAAWADGRERTYTASEMLDAEPLLPGFSVPVTELFALPDDD